jgi:hypothetical protein
MKVGVEKKFDERDYTLRLLALFLNIIFFFQMYKKPFFVKFALFNPKNRNELGNRFFEFSRKNLHLLNKKNSEKFYFLFGIYLKFYTIIFFFLIS